MKRRSIRRAHWRAAAIAAAGPALLLAACGQPGETPAEPADPAGPALLFTAGKGDFDAADRGQVFDATGLVVAPDGSFVDGMCGQPAGASVEFRDMNADGKQEALVIYGNSCTSGHTGSSALLFIRDPNGKLQPNLGFPAASADPLPDRNAGYPDLLIGGPGFCFGVWRWNGATYDHLRNDPQMPGGCDQVTE